MVDILLATYNSEKYLEEQINSILLQIYRDWQLIIRDDGSTDGTLNIIARYIKQYPNKIRLVKDDVVCGSAKSNFFQLLSYASNDYVMFCDHDDYWLEDKVEVSLNRLKQEEKKLVKLIPLIVFTDYYVVDSKLNIIQESTTKNLQVARPYITLNSLLVQNYITGCTMIFNKSLYSRIGQVGDEALMHDWWLALFASAFGEIIYLDIPTIKYRQHGNNCVGAVDVKSIQYVKKKIMDSDTKQSYGKLFKQAKSFSKMYGKDMKPENYKIVDRFVKLQEKNKICKIYATLRFNYCKSNFVRILGQIYYI